jgi:DNA-binding response OmpR family regulator
MRKNFTLVIHQDDTIRRFICESLSFVGFFCKPFADCTGVVNFVLENPVTLIILDVDLSNLEAFDFLCHLKSKDPYVPIIATSAKTSDLSHLHISNVLLRPFTRMDLIGSVFDIISKSRNQNNLNSRHRLMAP